MDTVATIKRWGSAVVYVEYALPAVYLNSLGDRFGATAGRASPHKGQDIAPAGGGPVFAIANGTLVYDWRGGCLGNVAVVEHADGMFSSYSHMAAESPIIIGTRVSQGQAIGTIGNTGTCSMGRHLHLALSTSIAGAAGGFDVIDPMAYITAHPVRPVAAPARIDPGWLWSVPDKALQIRIQQGLQRRGRYAGIIDGDWGTWTIKGIQRTIIGSGYTGQVDGIPGPATCHFVQIYAQLFGSYTGPIDNKPGAMSWSGLALGLERR